MSAFKLYIKYIQFNLPRFSAATFVVAIPLLNPTSLSGYVVQGSNGEYVYLSAKEKIEVIEFVRKEVPKERLIIAGSGCEGKCT